MEKIAKKIGLIGLTMAGLTCIIGSGCLFGSYQAAKIAGPAAIFSWIIGGIAIIFIALTYAELGSMMPRVGGMVRYMEYTHGSLAGFMAAWTNWLAIVAVIPVEAVASVQYLSASHWQWTQNLFNMQTHALSTTGLIFASVFIVFYFLVNYWSVMLFIRFIVFITFIKIFVPLFTLIALFVTAFHTSNFTAYQGNIAPYGWSAVLTAIATSGIVFSFHGFQSIINLAGETKNPGRNIPLAITLALLFALVLYVLLQIVYIGAMPPSFLQQGWSNLVLSSPFAQLAIALNLHLLLITLYVGSVISPSGTAVTYMGTTTRMLYGMSENGYMPKFMTFLNEKYQVPRQALWTNLAVAFIFLWIFKGWSSLIPIVSLTGVISYLTGPISAKSLRHLAPEQLRPIRITGMRVIAPIAFIIISLILYWAKWPLTGKVILVIAAGFFIYIYYQNQKGWPNFRQQFLSGIWMIFYLFAMAALSYLGSNKFGGTNRIPYGWDMLCIAATALVFYFWGIKSAWMTPSLAEILKKPVEPTPETTNSSDLADDLMYTFEDTQSAITTATGIKG